MIDTDKYEGHTEGPWEYFYAKNCDDWILKTPLYIHSGKGVRMKKDSVDAQLIADAPLLLEELKRMNRFAHCAMNFMSEHDLHFQFLNEHGVFTAPDGGSISMFIPYSYKWDDETKVSSESIQFNVRGEEE